MIITTKYAFNLNSEYIKVGTELDENQLTAMLEFPSMFENTDTAAEKYQEYVKTIVDVTPAAETKPKK